MAKDLKQIIKALEKRGFKKQNCDGSLVKLFPPDNKLPFYSLHLGERAIHPLKRFAKSKWGLDIFQL